MGELLGNSITEPETALSCDMGVDGCCGHNWVTHRRCWWHRSGTHANSGKGYLNSSQACLSRKAAKIYSTMESGLLDLKKPSMQRSSHVPRGRNCVSKQRTPCSDRPDVWGLEGLGFWLRSHSDQPGEDWLQCVASEIPVASL